MDNGIDDWDMDGVFHHPSEPNADGSYKSTRLAAQAQAEGVLNQRQYEPEFPPRSKPGRRGVKREEKQENKAPEE